MPGALETPSDRWGRLRKVFLTVVARRIENQVTGVRVRTDRRSLETRGPNVTGSASWIEAMEPEA
jgi:hypothetical protein